MMFDVERGLADIRDWAGKMADYPVEVGEDGIWTYVKMRSGIAVCWGIYTTTNGTKRTEGASYFTGQSGTYPAGLFSTRPVLLGDPRWNWIGGFNQASTSNDKDGWYGYLWSFSNSPTHSGIKINLFAVGLYKPLETVGGGGSA